MKKPTVKEFQKLKQEHLELIAKSVDDSFLIDDLHVEKDMLIAERSSLKIQVEREKHLNLSNKKAVYDYYDHNVKLKEYIKSMSSVVYRYELFTILVISLTLLHVLLVAIHV